MVASNDSIPASSERSNKLTLVPLTALVVGPMIGSGIFNLPSDMSRNASPGAIIIGWVISGIGMLMLAFVYQSLAMRKPELNSGPYAYAKAGFGSFVGFTSAWGYWLSASLANVAFVVAIFSALSFFIPAFGDGNNLLSIIGASICLVMVRMLILRGVKEAALINVFTTVAKLIPLVLFVLIAVIAFNWDKFTFNFWGENTSTGGAGLGSVLDQVKSTMLVTLWVFIGIEGASVCSARAAKRSDVGLATVIGFLLALVLYVSVSLLSTGLLGQPELAALGVPSMAGVLEVLIGHWGAAVINLGLLISVGGAFLSWTVICAEIPFVCGRDGTFPRWFGKENATGAPANALLATNILVQIFVIVSFFSQSAYQFFAFISSVAILPPYVLSGAYALKLALLGETYGSDGAGRGRDMIVGALATIYGIWLIYAAGLNFLMLCTLLFLPGILVFAMARRERGEKAFAGAEIILAGMVVALAALAGWLLITGEIAMP